MGRWADWQQEGGADGQMGGLAEAQGAPDEFVVEHPAVIRCAFCGGVLPTTRQVNFCPQCGMGQDVGKCGKCGADVDVGWRYCVTCGEELHGVTS